ncbi:hypothetical protein [Nocardia farcinica]|uniref:hypothetical protein n=1 Tax=Nocardia farcinica TaxID=37329 RepID=UPI0024586769|nr:hypothetical protein [Nocardia farcinica]
MAHGIERPADARRARAQFADTVLATVTGPDRIAALVDRIVGDRIEVGPLPVGPGGLVSATAVARPWPVRLTAVPERDWEFAMFLPMLLHVRVRIPGRTVVFSGAVAVRTTIALEPAGRCALAVRIAEIGRSDVRARLHPADTVAGLLGRLGRVERLVADRVRRVAAEVFDSPAVRELRHIDVAALIDRALWTDLLPAAPAPPLGAHGVSGGTSRAPETHGRQLDRTDIPA